MSSYQPVKGSEDLGVFTIDDDDENFLYDNSENSDDPHAVISQDTNGQGRVIPLELNDEEETAGFSSSVNLFSWRDPWFPNILVICLFVVPIAMVWMSLIYQLIGQWYAITPFMAHAWAALTTCYTVVWKEHTLSHSCWRFITTINFWIDIVVLSAVYPLVANVLIESFWLEADGTIVLEYQNEVSLLTWMIRLSYVSVGMRVFIGSTSLLSCCCTFARCPRCLATCLACFDSPRQGWTPMKKDRFKKCLRYFLGLSSLLTFAGLAFCIFSAVVHFGVWDAPSETFYEDCDALDTTECWLPFPSYRHMVQDSTTETGWRVNLHPRRLPPLKGGESMDPSFLNELDGFSTMAPMIFYIDGLKEALENSLGVYRLMGSADVAQSVSEHSITLLVDVTAQSLVAHTAEIDYLDPERPLVLMFPGQPLSHNHHYAVAVVNARDNNGERLAFSPHLTKLVFGTAENTTETTFDLDPGRGERYRTILIPMLLQVAPWLDLTNDPAALQLLFDFHTVSSASQLGPVRAVRNGTLSVLNESDWSWPDHIHVTKQVDYECGNDGNYLARTIYADMDVPWFLEDVGPGHRSARLDSDLVASGRHLLWGKVKFVVHIPCSIREAINTNNGNQDIVRAVVEYGHGLFYGLEEASEHYLQKIAHENRYVITAMDFRGMSASDLLIVAKTLLSQPSLFEAVRDNLIQGYGAKFALQHFAQHGLFETQWFHFDENDPSAPPSFIIDGGHVTRVYYGNSQGGILGAGYSALAGPTLLDRAVLGVPGTPFALIMSRSADFVGYDGLMLLLMYNNRHVRMLLCLVQMAWDSVEGSGVLAPPVEEPFPPTLLQAGLGDPIVPTIAAEALARGYGAVMIPNNPRGDVYEIPYPLDDKTSNQAPGSSSAAAHVTLTEIMFAEEYASLPANDVLPQENMVHICVRLDHDLIDQMTEFINTGNVVDVCVNNGCQRERADCF